MAMQDMQCKVLFRRDLAPLELRTKLLRGLHGSGSCVLLFVLERYHLWSDEGKKDPMQLASKRNLKSLTVGTVIVTVTDS